MFCQIVAELEYKIPIKKLSYLLFTNNHEDLNEDRICVLCLTPEAALTQMKEIYSSINISIKLNSLGFAKGWQLLNNVKANNSKIKINYQCILGDIKH